MIPILAVWLLGAQAARATPQLELCLPLAPASCALSDKSGREDYLKCFGHLELTASSDAESRCAEELLHARVHIACDAADIPGQCGDVKPGNDRVMTCMRAHRAKLTKPCARALKRYDEFTGYGRRKGKRRNPVSAVRC